MIKEDSMKKAAAAAAAALVLVLVPASALAASSNHAGLPEPGTKNCQGTVSAFDAQYVQANGLEGTHPGLAGIAAYAGLTVKEYQALQGAYCAS